MKHIITGLFFAGMATISVAQNPVDTGNKPSLRISAELRPRTEYSHGYSTLAAPEQKPSLFTSQRTRLNMDFRVGKVQSRISLQDTRIWGNQPQQVTNEDFAVSVHEAWAETPLVKDLSLRLGRQELSYDNSRIFGNSNWNQQARSHDLALLKYKGFVEVHFGVAYHESGNRKNNFYSGPDAYKFMQLLWMNKSFGNLKVSVLGVNNGLPLNTLNGKGEITDQEIRFNQTVGSYAEYKAGKLSFAGNAFYQTGRLVNGKTLSAFEYLLEATWKPGESFTLTAGFEELSGTDEVDFATKANSFLPLFSSGHIFNGHMDYFYAGNHTATVGLRDLFVKTRYPIKGINLGLDIHQFWAQADLKDSPAKMLGTELDFYAGYKINEVTELNIGYSHMLPTETLQILKGGSADATQNWAWVMVTFRPGVTF